MHRAFMAGARYQIVGIPDEAEFLETMEMVHGRKSFAWSSGSSKYARAKRAINYATLELIKLSGSEWSSDYFEMLGRISELHKWVQENATDAKE
jgi:hypothetical protein